MHSNYYDVVVCGGDLTGLVAAALLGRRGYRVLLCGHDAHPTRLRAAGYVLANEPGLLPSPESEPMARVLRELNYVQIVRRRAPPLRPGTRVKVPGCDIDLLGDADATRAALARAFPDELAALGAGLQRLWDASALCDSLLAADMTLPPAGFWDRREVARIAGQLPPADSDLLAPLSAEHPVRVAASALALTGSHLGPSDVGLLARARAFVSAAQGLHRLDGGMPALRALFTEKLQTTAGDIRERVSPGELQYRRGRVVGLRLFPRDEAVGVGSLVWAGPSASLRALMGDQAGRRLREASSSIRPACYRYGLSLLLDRAGLPAQTPPRLLSVQSTGRPLLEQNLIAITFGAPPAAAGEGVPVWVECLVPASALTSGIGYLGLVRARIREHLREVIPGFEDHLLVMASPHDGLCPIVPDGRPSPEPAEPITAIPMTPAWTSDGPSLLGIGASPHATSTPNVFLASSENLPGLGREGDFVSAYGLARLISRSSLRPQGPRKEIVILEG